MNEEQPDKKTPPIQFMGLKGEFVEKHVMACPHCSKTFWYYVDKTYWLYDNDGFYHRLRQEIEWRDRRIKELETMLFGKPTP